MYFEDIPVGQVFKTSGRTITESDIVAFAGLSGDYNSVHVDAHFAASTPLQGRVAQGLLVLAIATGLTQADLDYGRSLATAAEASQKQRPAAPDTDHSADACAICAVISLASSMLFATPPLLQLPQAVQLLYLTTNAEFDHLNKVLPAFQPRAPPAS